MEKLEINPQRIASILGKITYESITKTIERIGMLKQEKPEEEIFLVISSGGGSCEAGFMFIDMIQIMKIKLVTIGSGEVSSMAIPLFCLGKRRFLTPHTSLLFHEVVSSPLNEGFITLSRVEAKQDNLVTIQYWYASFIAERSNRKLTTKGVLDLVKKDTWVLPGQAIKLGLAHAIADHT